MGKFKTIMKYSICFASGVVLTIGVNEYFSRKNNDRLLKKSSELLAGMVADYKKGVVSSYTNIANIVKVHVPEGDGRRIIEDTLEYYQQKADRDMFEKFKQN